MEASEKSNSLSDFTRMDCQSARRHVCELIHIGFPDATVAALTGWSIGDVRRAMGDRLACEACDQ
jgi:hypothetical protein